MHVFILTAHRTVGQSKVFPGVSASFWSDFMVLHCMSPKVGRTDVINAAPSLGRRGLSCHLFVFLILTWKQQSSSSCWTWRPECTVGKRSPTQLFKNDYMPVCLQVQRCFSNQNGGASWGDVMGNLSHSLGIEITAFSIWDLTIGLFSVFNCLPPISSQAAFSGQLL